MPIRIEVWTDGSGTWGADSPACIGVHVVVDDPDDQPPRAVVEASEYVGIGTNNVAELRAIRRGLFLATILVGQLGHAIERGVDIVVRSDSEYAIGAIEWEHPRANVPLINAIRAQLRAIFENHAGMVRVEWAHVRGHTGVEGNEIADWLAHVARCRTLRREVKRVRPGDPKPPRAARKRPLRLTANDKAEIEKFADFLDVVREAGPDRDLQALADAFYGDGKDRDFRVKH